MKIAIKRSGGFAAVAKRGEIDTATLPRDQAGHLEALARAAEREAPAPAAAADAFAYEIDIDGRRHVVRDARGAWGQLIESLGY